MAGATPLAKNRCRLLQRQHARQAQELFERLRDRIKALTH